MNIKLTAGLALIGVLGLVGCTPASKQQETASQAFKLIDCAKAANITGKVSTGTMVKDGKKTQIFLPGDGVSPAQAAKANACLGN